MLGGRSCHCLDHLPVEETEAPEQDPATGPGAVLSGLHPTPTHLENCMSLLGRHCQEGPGMFHPEHSASVHRPPSMTLSPYDLGCQSALAVAEGGTSKGPTPRMRQQVKNPAECSHPGLIQSVRQHNLPPLVLPTLLTSSGVRAGNPPPTLGQRDQLLHALGGC